VTRMHSILLAGLFGCLLTGPRWAHAQPGTVRSGSIKRAEQPSSLESTTPRNTYNPTLVARRQPQPMMAEEIPPNESVPEHPGNGSLLDEIEPPKPILRATPQLENPVLDDSHLDEMPAEPWSSGSWFQSGGIYAEVDFLVFERQRGKRFRQPLATDFASSGNVLTTLSNTFGNEPGVRATLGKNLYRDYLNRDHSVEFSFTGINQFQIDDGIRGAGVGSLYTTDIAGFNASDSAMYNQSSTLYSYEANYRIRTRLERDRMVMGPDGSWTRQYTHGHVFSVLFGLRHVSFDEDFLLSTRQNGGSAVNLFWRLPSQYGERSTRCADWR
jgi:hypothetical protein